MEDKKCVQCGKVFTMTDSEKRFFENRNLTLPKRCKECREKNNPHQLKTNIFQVTPKREKKLTIRKILLILSILFIAFSLLYINSKFSSEEYQNAQEVSAQEVSAQEVSAQEVSAEEVSAQEVNAQEVNSSDGYTLQSEGISQEHLKKLSYTFKSEGLLQEHFNKHGSEFGYTYTSQYESGANAVINSPNALHKTEAEDGDSVYYIKATNEFVILSTEGYIRTYFKPEDGIDYYNRQ